MMIIDVWLIVHFFAGGILFKLYSKKFKSKKKALKFVLISLIGFEFFELLFFKSGLAIPEPFINQVLDVLIGMLGAKVAMDRKF